VRTYKGQQGAGLRAREEVKDIVGLYLNPPDNAIVLSDHDVRKLRAGHRPAHLLQLQDSSRRYEGTPSRVASVSNRNLVPSAGRGMER
jgi:hypothetical protein